MFDIEKRTTRVKPVTATDLGLNIDEVEQQLAANRSLPIHTYWDPLVYEFELDAMFHNTWQYFAPLEKLSQKGDVVTGTIGRIPVAVSRAEDGKLHGFVNICRHRGYTVIEGDKRNCRSFVCRYHTWSYRLNGDLANAPDTDKETGFDKTEFGLLKVSVDTFGLGVFVNADPAAPPLRVAHPTLDAFAAKAGMNTDVSRYRLYRTITTEQASNWKLWYDNGTECYHCPSIHDKSFSDAFNTDSGTYSTRTEGKLTSYSFKSATNNDPDALIGSHYGSVQAFPCFQTVRQDDMWYFGKLTPTGPESCVFTADYFIEEGADTARVDRWIEIWDKTFSEDADATVVQQKNLRTGRAQPFRYVSNREELSQFMLSHIWSAYKEHLVDDGPSSAIAAE